MIVLPVLLLLLLLSIVGVLLGVGMQLRVSSSCRRLLHADRRHRV